MWPSANIFYRRGRKNACMDILLPSAIATVFLLRYQHSLPTALIQFEDAAAMLQYSLPPTAQTGNYYIKFRN
jgi:hypothetical protein